MRIALAKLLLGRPTLLLLDEPTNHLDLDARNWLEEYLVVVSARRHPRLARPVLPRLGRHADRRDLAADDRPTTSAITPSYLVERDARLETPAAGQARAGRGNRADARVHRSVPLSGDEGRAGAEPHQDARQDRADRSAARTQARALHVSDAARRAGAIVLELHGRPQGLRRPTSCSNGVNLHIERGDRIALVAPNGAGKSTLMRLLAGVEAARLAARGAKATRSSCSTSRRTKPTGSIRRRPSTRRWRADSPVGMVPMIRNILGGFLFSGDDIYKKAGVLSGGERTRLAVARMLLRPANTLLLDEPTNHLDLDSKDVLLEALEDFGGTLIFVSHDRYFVDDWPPRSWRSATAASRSIPAPTSSSCGAGSDAGQTAVRPARPASGRRPKPAPDSRRRRRPTGSSAAAPPARARDRRRPPSAHRSRCRRPDRPPAADSRRVRREEARGRRDRRRKRGRRRAATADRGARRPDRRARAGNQAISKAKMAAPGFYDDRELAESLVIEASRPHVGGRRPDEPVGSAPGPPPNDGRS